MLIYFAGPLFCPAERIFNSDLTKKLEHLGFSVFLPQRDGIDLEKPRYYALANEEKYKTIFETDRDQILKADIFLIVLDGRVPDEGACLELGIAYGHKHLVNKDKFLIGLHSDWRVFSADFTLNAMILGSLDCLVNQEEELFSKLEAYKQRVSDK